MGVSNVIRRTLCLMLIAVMLIAAAAPALAAKKGSGAYVVTTDKDRLNVHSTPVDSDENIVDKLKKGTVVVYKSTKKGWWKVQYYGGYGSGYVDRDYLTSVTSMPFVRFKALKTVPVYKKAKAKARYYIGRLKKGQKVYILKTSGSWAYVSRNGNIGWINAIYLRRA